MVLVLLVLGGGEGEHSNCGFSAVWRLPAHLDRFALKRLAFSRICVGLQQSKVKFRQRRGIAIIEGFLSGRCVIASRLA
eukprot:866725-Pleurochrysis_carterae.AAC.1